LQDLGTLGGVNSVANGINNSGQVVGSFTNSQGNSRAFLFTGGAMREVGTLGGDSSNANGINDAGQIVGTAQLAAASPGQVMASHAFLDSNGTLQDLGTLGGASSAGNGINASGMVVGESDRTTTCTESPCPDRHAFLFSNGRMQDIGSLGGFSTAFAINNAGQIVGESLAGGNTHAFLFVAGKMTDLGTVNGGNSSARAINNAGQIVGFTSNPGAPILFPPQDNHAMIFTESDNKMRDLNTLIPANSGWVLLSANGINDSGQIVGEGIHNGNSGSAFLLTPVK
jgi:probable HAF family extracellular repeat protein